MPLIPTDDPDVVVYERDDPLLTITVTTLAADGVTVIPYSLVNTTILQFLVKRIGSDLDASAIATYGLGTGVTITNAAGGVCTVQCSSTNATATPGTRRCHLVGTTAGKRQTLLVSNFVVKEI